MLTLACIQLDWASTKDGLLLIPTCLPDKVGGISFGAIRRTQLFFTGNPFRAERHAGKQQISFLITCCDVQKSIKLRAANSKAHALTSSSLCELMRSNRSSSDKKQNLVNVRSCTFRSSTLMRPCVYYLLKSSFYYSTPNQCTNNTINYKWW